MRNILAILLFMTATCSITLAENKSRFATIFSDNLVLQQNSLVNIWGYADKDVKLSLKCSWLETAEEVVANPEGKWTASVNTLTGSFKTETIELYESGRLTSVLSNVLVGEVWLCSGQSNMEMVMMNQPQWNLFVENSEKEITAANYPYIRFVNIQRKESFDPVEEVMSYGWKVCNPNDVKWLSAVGFFYAKELFKNLNIPVGLIVSSYGGSPVQSWIPESITKGNSRYVEENIERKAEVMASKQTETQHLKAMSEWLTESAKSGFKGNGIALKQPVNIEKSHVGNHMGQFSLTKVITNTGGKNLHFDLGTIDDYGQVYFNGEKVWEELRNSKSYSQIKFNIPASKVKAGNNTIEARVINVLWGGGLTGPDMYYTAGNDTTKITLKGEWVFRKGFDLKSVKAVPREGKPLFSMLSALYNGMLHPLVNYKIKGFLFYQGEANVGDTNRYPVMLTDMIKSWRKAFNDDLPFYFVQIAPYKYSDEQHFKAAELRQSQALVERTVLNTAMIATIDLGNPVNIHPAKKMEVGVRLANTALANTYKTIADYKFPKLGSVKREGDKMVLTIVYAFEGLEERGECQEFEVSEDGKKFKIAKVKVEGNRIILDWDRPLTPKFLRYCWADDCTGKIFNSKGLPLSSFKTRVRF